MHATFVQLYFEVLNNSVDLATEATGERFVISQGICQVMWPSGRGWISVKSEGPLFNTFIYQVHYLIGLFCK